MAMDCRVVGSGSGSTQHRWSGHRSGRRCPGCRCARRRIGARRSRGLVVANRRLHSPTSVCSGDDSTTGLEGTGAYGAGLDRHLRSEQVNVIEAPRPDRRSRRNHGKSDSIDAEAAVRAVLAGTATVISKHADGPVEAIRALRVARIGAIRPIQQQQTPCAECSSPHQNRSERSFPQAGYQTSSSTPAPAFDPTTTTSTTPPRPRQHCAALPCAHVRCAKRSSTRQADPGIAHQYRSTHALCVRHGSRHGRRSPRDHRRQPRPAPLRTLFRSSLWSCPDPLMALR